jgi:hypothetical protein
MGALKQQPLNAHGLKDEFIEKAIRITWPKEADDMMPFLQGYLDMVKRTEEHRNKG